MTTKEVIRKAFERDAYFKKCSTISLNDSNKQSTKNAFFTEHSPLIHCSKIQKQFIIIPIVQLKSVSESNLITIKERYNLTVLVPTILNIP